MRELPSVRHDAEDDFIVQVWDAEGNITNAGEHVAELPRQRSAGFATIKVADTFWRVFTALEGGSTVQVSQQVEVRRELAETAALQVAVPLLVLVPVGCLVVGLAMGQALGDLNRLTRHVENLPADSRDPIEQARVPSEAAPLVVAMNRLVERLRDSLSQQRKFLSDAAHELRTPLTALDLRINNLAKAETSAMPRMLVDQLLRMAWLDAAADIAECHDLDLRAVVLQAIADHVTLAESRSIDLGPVSSAFAPFSGSERELRTMVGNLIDNAVKYTPGGGTVDFGLTCHELSVVIQIVDTGPGIDPALIARVFDHFFRAASSDVERRGLGLAVAQAIAKRHGLTVAIANQSDRSGLRVTLSGKSGRQSTSLPHTGKARPDPSTASHT